MAWFTSLGATWLVALIVTSLIAIWVSKSWIARTAIICIYVAMLCFTLVAAMHLMGRAKPVELAYFERNVPDAEIISMYAREDAGIFLTLLLPDEKEPGLYKYPWSTEMAENVGEALSQAQQMGTSAGVRNPFTAFEPQTGLEGAIQEIVDQLFGSGQGQGNGQGGEGQGEGEGNGEGQGNGEGSGGNENSLEDRPPPFAYPRPPSSPGPKPPRPDNPVIVDQPGE